MSENTLLNWSDQEYARWRQRSNGHIYLVRGQDGFGTVDQSSRVVGFKTTDPIERILAEYATQRVWTNSKDFGYPLTLVQILARKGRSPYAEGLSLELSQHKLPIGQDLELRLQRSFPDSLPYRWSIGGNGLGEGVLTHSLTELRLTAAQLRAGLHTLEVLVFAPQDTVRLIQDFFVMAPTVRLLQDLPLLRQQQAWGAPGMGKSVEGRALSIDKHPYGFGIGSHAESSLEFSLAGQHSTLHVTIGLDDESACGDGAQWLVRGDQRELFRSEILTSLEKRVVKLDVTGVQQLELTTLAGANNMCDHTNWANAWLE